MSLKLPNLLPKSLKILTILKRKLFTKVLLIPKCKILKFQLMKPRTFLPRLLQETPKIRKILLIIPAYYATMLTISKKSFKHLTILNKFFKQPKTTRTYTKKKQTLLKNLITSLISSRLLKINFAIQVKLIFGFVCLCFSALSCPEPSHKMFAIVFK